MPFGNITVNTRTFEPRQSGIYSLSTVAFGQPSNEFRIRGGVRGRDGLTRASIIRLREKDVTLASGSVVREQQVISLPIVTTPNFTVAEMDADVSDISEFVTQAILSRILVGES